MSSRLSRALVFAAATVWFAAAPAVAQVTHGCVTVGSGTAPQFDGVLEAGPAWFGALRMNMNDNMGVPRTAFMDMIKRGNELYLGLHIDTPDSTNLDDTVVLTFSPGTGAAHDWRLHIKPWDSNGNPKPGGFPQSLTYWRNSSPWPATANTPGAGAWVNDNNFQVTKNGTSWEMEIRVPITTNPTNAALDTGVYIPTTTPFGFYVNVLSTSTLLGQNQFFQAAWPQTASITLAMNETAFLRNKTPPVTAWGQVSTFSRTDCTGVEITTGGVRYTTNTSDSLTTTIKTAAPPAGGFPADCNTIAENGVRQGPPNYLIARVRNTTTAQNSPVSVTYLLKNYGIPGVTGWQPVTVGLMPPQTDPTMEETVNAGMTREYVLDWAMTARQSCQYAKAPAYPQQCSRILIDSTDSNTRFLSRDIMFNLHFAQASRLDVPAEISAQGYGPAPAGGMHRFVLDVSTETQRYQRRPDRDYDVVKRRPNDQIPPELARIASVLFPAGLEEAMTQIIRGYLARGSYLVMDNSTTKYEYHAYVGGFGIVAGHIGRVQRWTQQLTGPGLQPVNASKMILQIAPESTALIQATIEARGCFEPRTALVLLPLAFVFLGVAVHRRRS